MVDTFVKEQTLRPSTVDDISTPGNKAGTKEWNYLLVYWVRSQLDPTVFEGPKILREAKYSHNWPEAMQEFKNRFKAGLIWVACTEWEKEQIAKSHMKGNRSKNLDR